MSHITLDIINQLSEISCEKVAERLGIDVQRHKALCFMHDDHHPSLSFYGKNRERWLCFVCNEGGNAIDLVMKYTNLTFIETCSWLGAQFGINIGNQQVFRKKPISVGYIKKKSVVSEQPPFSIEVTQWILENNTLTEKGKDFLYGQRHLNMNVIKQYNIISIDDGKSLVNELMKVFDINALQKSGFITMKNGKAYFRMFTPCLIFPYYDLNGNIIGVQSRYLGIDKEAPRFQFVSSQKTRLYNMPIIKTMSDGDDLFISEGITDCLALLSSGKKAIALPSATNLPKMDLLELTKFRLHIYPDKDAPGETAYVKLRTFFINHYALSFTKEQLPSGCKDYSDYYLALIKK